MGIAQLDKMVVIVQDFDFKRTTKGWRIEQVWEAGLDMDLDRPTLVHKYNHKQGREASLFDISVSDLGHCRLQFNPSRIELSQVESVLRDKGFNTSLIDATMYRLDLQKTQVLSNPAYCYHQLLNLAARKQRTALRADETWYSNRFQKNVGGVQICFYDAAAKHKSLNPGSCRLEARIQGIDDCRSYGIDSVSDLAHLDNDDLYVRLVKKKLPYLHNIESEVSLSMSELYTKLFRAALNNNKKGGSGVMKDFMSSLGVLGIEASYELIIRIIDELSPDRHRAYHYRKEFKDKVVSTRKIIAQDYDRGPTMAQELRLFIAA